MILFGKQEWQQFFHLLSEKGNLITWLFCSFMKSPLNLCQFFLWRLTLFKSILRHCVWIGNIFKLSDSFESDLNKNNLNLSWTLFDSFFLKNQVIFSHFFHHFFCPSYELSLLKIFCLTSFLPSWNSPTYLCH